MMAGFLYLVLVLFATYFAIGGESCEGGNWHPDNVTERCRGDTKQKVMYGWMTFDPPLKEKLMTGFQVDVEWNALAFNPCTNTKKSGGVYVSYTFGIWHGPKGYCGVQIRSNRGQLIFSIWDHNRYYRTPEGRVIQAAEKLAWPVDTKHCRRNCQDCDGSSKEKKLGLTTGTICTYPDRKMKVGDRYTVRLRQISANYTINTADYDGFNEAHKVHLNETDRKVTGGLWKVHVVKQSTGESFQVGKMLFEGDGSGMYRLGTFDEMIGCNRCNSVYHKDTRYGPVVTSADGTKRKPTKMQGTAKAGSICKDYFISGSKYDSSISFEGGPLTTTPFETGVDKLTIW